MWYYAILSVTTFFFSFCWYLASTKGYIRNQRKSTGVIEYWQKVKPGSEVQDGNIHRTVESCHDFLTRASRAEEFGDHGHRVAARPLTPLEARAGPNQRLVKAFGIDNAFTTVDEDYHKAFRMKVVKALKTSDEDWCRLWRSTRGIVRDQVARQEWKTSLPLASLVRIVVFKVVLLQFFPDSALINEDLAIAKVTELINVLWVDSKTSGYLGSKSGNLFAPKEAQTSSQFVQTDGGDLATLQESLGRIFPTYQCNDPVRTPLNIILPAYETLWRVVLRCVIEIVFRNGDVKDPWESCIFHFNDKCKHGRRFLWFGDTDDLLSILDIAKEALRLYPPTKRIYRWEQQEGDGGVQNANPKLSAADVEAIHRDCAIWGPDALQFNPERWVRYFLDDTQRVKGAFLPFGYGNLSCPAKGDFGPKIIGLLVAVLVEELGVGYDWATDLEEDRLDQEGPLRTARDSYATLKLRRV